MQIFITGIAGFLGSNLADYYIKKGFKVSGCDNLIGGDLYNVDPKVKFYNADCEDLVKMKKIIKDVDVVIHAAAYAHENLSIFSPNLISKNIINGSTSVFSAAISNKVKRIVFCSSIARYGEVKIPYLESGPTMPSDPYGISKLAAEKILINLCNTYGVEYNIAVPHNIIGIKQKYDDPFRNVASIMINLMLQNRQPIIYGDGEQKRSFSDVDDCVYCIDKLATDPDIKFELVNIGPGPENEISVNDLFKKISNQVRFNQKPIYKPERVNEVKNAICSSSLAEKLFKVKSNQDIESIISKMIQFIKTKGVKKFNYNYEIEINNELTPDTWSKKLI
ncbi:NAD-dependent epimerase/dehydratase family protein [Candidatus Pelagibacter sp. HIMB1636]|uniref:NAD-dependent epimerase/dehydratase family protein n=1 Tax=Candidatus Pelagibacter sp. HIMB1636 TaxID=3413360 RepID=UPI003F866436